MQAPIFFYKVNPVRIFHMHQELQYLQKWLEEIFLTR